MTTPDQPIPWTITIDDMDYRGEILTARLWSATLVESFDPSQARFRIVVLASSAPPPPIADTHIAVWVPAEAIAETSVQYLVRGREDSRQQLLTLLDSQAYRPGRTYTSQGQLAGLTFDLPSDTIDRIATNLMLTTVAQYMQFLIEGSLTINFDELEEASQTLLEVHRDLSGRVDSARTAMDRLVQELDSPVGQTAQQALARFQRLADVAGPTAFGAIAEEFYISPSGFSPDIDSFKALEYLAGLQEEIIALHSYLDGVSVAQIDPQLSVDLTSIQQQLNLAELSEQPQIWSSIQATFRWFRSRYIALYQDRHTAFQGEVTPLYTELEQANLQVDALSRLNDLSELGEPLAEKTLNAYHEMLERLKPCSIDQISEATLIDRPTCPECGMPLSATPPTRQANEFLRQLKNALEDQCRRISRLAARRVLSDHRRGRMDRLIKVAQVSDLTSLVNVLDDDLIALLRDLLRQTTS